MKRIFLFVTILALGAALVGCGGGGGASVAGGVSSVTTIPAGLSTNQQEFVDNAERNYAVNPGDPVCAFEMALATGLRAPVSNEANTLKTFDPAFDPNVLALVQGIAANPNRLPQFSFGGHLAIPRMASRAAAYSTIASAQDAIMKTIVPYLDQISALFATSAANSTFTYAMTPTLAATLGLELAQTVTMDRGHAYAIVSALQSTKSALCLFCAINFDLPASDAVLSIDTASFLTRRATDVTLFPQSRTAGAAAVKALYDAVTYYNTLGSTSVTFGNLFQSDTFTPTEISGALTELNTLYTALNTAGPTTLTSKAGGFSNISINFNGWATTADLDFKKIIKAMNALEDKNILSTDVSSTLRDYTIGGLFPGATTKAALQALVDQVSGGSGAPARANAFETVRIFSEVK